MKKAIIFISLCLTIKASKAQILLTKDSLDFVFKETLAKSRNAVSNATNNWRFDNSNDDYFKQDTIILNTARSYKMNYCNGINWSFYKEKHFILEFTQTCNEPPTKLKSKKEDYMRLQIKQRSNKFYLRLLNKKWFIKRIRNFRFEKKYSTVGRRERIWLHNSFAPTQISRLHTTSVFAKAWPDNLCFSI